MNRRLAIMVGLGLWVAFGPILLLVLTYWLWPESAKWDVGLWLWVIATLGPALAYLLRRLRQANWGPSIRGCGTWLGYGLLVSLVILGGIAWGTQPTTTSPETWRAALTLMGLPPATPRPANKGGVEAVIRQSYESYLYYDWKGRDGRPSMATCVEKQSVDLSQHDDFGAFSLHRAECQAAYEAYSTATQTNLIAVKGSSQTFVLVMQVLAAVLAAFVVVNFEGVGRLTATLLWVLLAVAWLLLFEVPAGPSRQHAWSLFVTGLTTRLFELGLTVLAIVWTATGREINREAQSLPWWGRTPVRILVAIVTGFAGLGLDSWWQTGIINGAVVTSSGRITADVAYRFYQLGLLGATTITGMVGTILVLGRAAVTVSPPRR